MWKDHEEKVLKSLNGESAKVKLEKILKEHKEKIKYLQHERLIHLIVTMTVALATMMLDLTTLTTAQIILLIPDVMLSALLVGYLFHYRMLENTTQRWYSLADKIREKLQ